MINTKPGSKQFSSNNERPHLEHLSQAHIRMIDEALDAVGEFGEVHLIVNKGLLRFVITQKSHDALKYRPGRVNALK